MSDRKAIKNRIIEIISGASGLSALGITNTDKQIFANRAADISDDLLPVISVYTLRESAAVLSDSPIQQYRRTLELAVDIYIKNSNKPQLQDKADDLIHKVESILLSNYKDHDSESPKWNHLVYRSFDANLNDLGDGDFSISRLIFDVIYDTETELADLTDYPEAHINIKAKAKYSIGGVIVSEDVSFDGDNKDVVDLSPPEN